MAYRKLAPDYESFPDLIPIFPLRGVLLLPGGQLPLNIFEERYLAMIDHALRCPSRMIGMIQPQQQAGDMEQSERSPVYGTGCAGRITTFEETADGRYLVTLTGICRFGVDQEQARNRRGFRQVTPDWSSYAEDLQADGDLNLDRAELISLLQEYFDQEGLSCQWDMLEDTDDQPLITCLSMICPLNPNEKQALLEAESCARRADIFLTMLRMAVHRSGDEDSAIPH